MKYMILAFLLLSGCIGAVGITPRNMTPEQIKAYKDLGMDVYSCLAVGGPPPTGGLVYLTVPKGSKPNVSFGANCQIVKAETNS